MADDSTTEMLHVMQHALGRDEYGRAKHGRDYRNRFCATPGTDSFHTCRRAVALGFMTERAPSDMSGGDHVFHVTDAGKHHVQTESPPPPKVSRGKARYMAWLNSAAADCGISFGSWLKDGCP